MSVLIIRSAVDDMLNNINASPLLKKWANKDLVDFVMSTQNNNDIDYDSVFEFCETVIDMLALLESMGADLTEQLDRDVLIIIDDLYNNIDALIDVYQEHK